ncbi:MAG: alanine--tRNA ligase [Candidatus Pacebacteria bacterium]|nr:alanine--tRNA ligase [Candidatus Paceibacterota bacterium]
MNHEEIRKKFIEFFKKNGHESVPSSSLLPDDPSVLLTTAGMQQFKKYFTGELDPMQDFKSKNTVSIQKCFRTSDIDEVGDERHLTFFEMLGNFSFGGYWKEEAIKYAYEFIAKEMGLEIDYVTVFDPEKVSAGDWRRGVPYDEESYKIWQKYVPKEKIRREGADNFWGPTGNEGPCGPTTEIYVDGIEIWNVVFNQFYRDKENKLTDLKIRGIDTGMGLERLAMVSQKKKNVFETDLFESIVRELPEEMEFKTKLIFTDHARSSAFLISDGIRPSNKDAGYVLRRLLRRVITYNYIWLRSHPESKFSFRTLIDEVVSQYGYIYQNLNREIIAGVCEEEYVKFNRTIEKGLKELDVLMEVDAKKAFDLYQSFGLPYEVVKELAGSRASILNRDDFDKKFVKHQEISKAGAEKKFGGHGLLLDTGELKAKDEVELKKVTRLHTATHLLQAALRKVLGSEVSQKGSDVTAERTRFDFAFGRKLTPEEIKKVEELVNGAVEADLPMQFKEMSKVEAEKTGALYFFREKYPERVKVYFAGKSLEDAFSKEFCGGPHVTHTGEVGKFKIAKEEAVGAGARRIRGVVEN